MKQKQTIPLLLACLLAIGTPSYTQNARTQKKQKPDLSIGINPMRSDSLRTSLFHIGLLARVRQLKGVGISLVADVVRTDAKGLQVAGLANVVGRNTHGVQLAGVTNVSGYDQCGLMVSGLVGVAGHQVAGITASGLVSVAGGSFCGLAASGLANVAADSYRGVAVAALGNVAAGSAIGLQAGGLVGVIGSNLYGLQAASLLNVCGDRTYGIQVSALANVGVHLYGMQLSAVANVVPESMRGLQAAVFNYAGTDARGLQLGLVNYAKDSHTRQLGLVNLKPDTQTQLVLSGGSSMGGLVGVRFLNAHTYTQLGVSLPYLDWNEHFGTAFSYRAGVHQPIGRRFRLSGDAGFAHIETFRADSPSLPARAYALQLRIQAECQVAARCTLFAAGGYGWTRSYHGPSLAHKPFYEFGLILF
ncbi:MAG: hypothetical protein ACI36X_08770 [Bacteroidaceae bacterium]